MAFFKVTLTNLKKNSGTLTNLLITAIAKLNDKPCCFSLLSTKSIAILKEINQSDVEPGSDNQSQISNETEGLDESSENVFVIPKSAGVRVYGSSSGDLIGELWDLNSNIHIGYARIDGKLLGLSKDNVIGYFHDNGDIFFYTEENTDESNESESLPEEENTDVEPEPEKSNIVEIDLNLKYPVSEPILYNYRAFFKELLIRYDKLAIATHTISPLAHSLSKDIKELYFDYRKTEYERSSQVFTSDDGDKLPYEEWQVKYDELEGIRQKLESIDELKEIIVQNLMLRYHYLTNIMSFYRNDTDRNEYIQEMLENEEYAPIHPELKEIWKKLGFLELKEESTSD